MRHMPRYIAEVVKSLRLSGGRLTRLVCLSLFFLIQTMTLAHAAEFNGEPHEHEGVSCTIALIAPEVDAIIPPAPIMSAPEAFKAPIIFTPFISLRHSAHDCRGPPGRAPPTL